MKDSIILQFLDMVDQTFSPAVTGRVMAAAGLPAREELDSRAGLSRADLWVLATLLSAETGIAVTDLLREFGAFLFRRLAQDSEIGVEAMSPAPAFMDSLENYVLSCVSFLGNKIDRLEQRVVERTRELQLQRDLVTQLMNTMAQGLIVTDAQARFEYVNAAAQRLGYDPQNLIGRPVFELAFPEDYPLLAEQHALRMAGQTTTYEVRLKCADGSPVYALVTGIPRRQGNQIVGSIAVISDLTDRKAMEEMLAQARDQALQMAREKSQHMAILSHEIRTPMYGIIGTAELLLETPLEAGQKQFVSVILESAQALKHLLDEYLTYSRLEAGKEVPDRIPFDLRGIVHGAVSLLAPKAKKKNLLVISSVDAQIPQRVQGDPGRLRQVLINLLSNAIKFTRQGRIAVQVQLEEETATQVVLRFVVRDTGIGVPQAIRQQLFEPFFHGPRSTDSLAEGAGLGLSIARHLVELMEGQIGVESQEGEGSIFWFVLPFDRVSSTPADIQPERSRPAGTIQANGRVEQKNEVGL